MFHEEIGKPIFKFEQHIQHPSADLVVRYQPFLRVRVERAPGQDLHIGDVAKSIPPCPSASPPHGEPTLARRRGRLRWMSKQWTENRDGESTRMPGRRWRQEDAETVLAPWEESGLSLSKFADEQGLSVQRLSWWVHLDRVFANFTMHRESKTSRSQAIVPDEIRRMREREASGLSSSEREARSKRAIRLCSGSWHETGSYGRRFGSTS
jgi:hypothetical protein